MIAFYRQGMTQAYNRASERETRRSLRRDSPKPELLLWSKLRNRRILDHKFRRQYSVGPYIVDFYCPLLKLAIEIDGETHFADDAILYDRNRQEFIESFGIRFLRFTNSQVTANLDGVFESIVDTISQSNQDLPSVPAP